jgi:flagellar hook assembly protein FlgD
MPKVKLVVYDLLGSVVRTLVDEQKSAGKHKVTFDASKLPSGVYFYQINIYAPGRAGSFNQVRKMLLLK